MPKRWRQLLNFVENGRTKKGIEENQALIVVCENNFHGRTTTIVSFSVDRDAYGNYGLFTPGFIVVPYNNAEMLEKVLNEKQNIVGFWWNLSRRSRSLCSRWWLFEKCYDLCRKKTMCCSLPMKCKQELRAPGNCLPAIMKEYILISLFWEKHYGRNLSGFGCIVRSANYGRYSTGQHGSTLRKSDSCCGGGGSTSK